MKFVKRSNFTMALSCSVLLSVAACSSNDKSNNNDNQTQTTLDTVTYNSDVAAIMNDSCVSCHAAGGIAPFSLENYESVAAYASVIKSSVQNRRMPPWSITSDGTCGTFTDSRAMSDADIAKIVAWVDAGAPRGSGELESMTPKALPTLSEGSAKIQLSTPSGFIPVAQGTSYSRNDDYHCFAVPNPHAGEKDFYLTGYDVLPGDKAYVHHVLAIPVDLDAPNNWYNNQGHLLTGVGAGGLQFDPDGTPLTNAQVIGLLKSQDTLGREGWPCFGTAGQGVSHAGMPVVWAPGQGAVKYPSQSGMKVASTAEIFVIQVHYNLHGSGANPIVLNNPVTPTQVVMEVADAVPANEGWFYAQDKFLMSIAYGDPSMIKTIAPATADSKTTTHTWDSTMEEILEDLGQPERAASVEYIDLHGFMPHMHQRGLTQTISVERANGDNVCGVNVTKWDFEWQLAYFRAEPIRMYHGDKLHVSCTWTGEGLSAPVYPGWGTENEMCFANIYAVLPASAP